MSDKPPTTEEAMLFAALQGDQATLGRLARGMLPNERRELTEAVDNVHDALVAAERREACDEPKQRGA